MTTNVQNCPCKSVGDDILQADGKQLVGDKLMAAAQLGHDIQFGVQVGHGMISCVQLEHHIRAGVQLEHDKLPADGELLAVVQLVRGTQVSVQLDSSIVVVGLYGHLVVFLIAFRGQPLGS